MSDLTAVVTIDGNTTSYFGRNYPDNNWIIYIDIELGKEYPISITWMALGVVVMVQDGELIANSYSDTASPILASLSAGANFDYDCDLTSNLSEVLAGSDPGEPGGPECVVESEPSNIVNPSDIKIPPTDDELTVPVVEQLFHPFADAGLAQRVTRFSQPVKVQLTNPDRRSAYRLSLWNRATNTKVSIDLLNDPRSGRFARFNKNTNDQITLQPTEGVDANCSATHCSIAFDWREQHWYELVFEEDESDSTRLHASILDPESQFKIPLGTLIIPSNTIWIEPTIVVLYQEQVIATVCAAGLPPITLHYRGGTANHLSTMEAPIHTLLTKCVTWGSGASTSEISGEPGGDIFTLTLGLR